MNHDKEQKWQVLFLLVVLKNWLTKTELSYTFTCSHVQTICLLQQMPKSCQFPRDIVFYCVVGITLPHTYFV